MCSKSVFVRKEEKKKKEKEKKDEGEEFELAQELISTLRSRQVFLPQRFPPGECHPQLQDSLGGVVWA